MFWGVTLETGKRYSQVVDSSYHLSMAALEPLSSAESPGSKFVQVMIEHNKSEFLLCTLEHNRVLQVHLDHCFVEGEEVTYFITGEGTVHLTGYIITDGVEDAEDSDDSEEGKAVSNSSTRKLINHLKKDNDESEDEEDHDWKPGIKKEKLGTALKGKSDQSAKPKHEKPKMPMGKPQKNELQAPLGKKMFFTPGAADSSDDDDEEDEDYEMLNEEEEEDSDSEDSEEGLGDVDGGGNDEEDSEWEDAEEEEGEEKEVESPAHTFKKAKLEEGRISKTKQGVSPALVKDSPHGGSGSGTPATIRNLNQEHTSSKKKKRKQSEESLKEKLTPVTKHSNTSPAAKLDSSGSKTQSSTETITQSGAKSWKALGGVQIQEIIPGSGPAAKPGKMVHVYYRGTFPNKQEFDSCTKGKAFSFRLGRSEVIKGWDVGIQGMQVGGKRKLIIPPAMGYGSKASGPIPPNSTLHFEIELKAVS